MKKWVKLATTILLEHPRLKVAEDDIRLPDGHTSKYIYFADMKSATMVVCIKGDSILTQTEYSYPPAQYMYQLPGGMIEDGEDPIPAGLRELEEESGYIVNEESTVEYLGYYFINNRRSDAKMHVILVVNPVDAKTTNWDSEEYIQSEWIKLSDVRNMIRNGEIVNSTILTGLALYDNRQTK